MVFVIGLIAVFSCLVLIGLHRLMQELFPRLRR